MDVRTLGIDAGHGGDKPGAQAGGIIEADLNIHVARKLKAAVLLNIQGVKPVLLRKKNDQAMSLEARGEESRKAGCDLVISIHGNAMADHPEWHGCLTFHWPGNTLGREVSNTIGRCWPRPLYRTGQHSISVDDAHGNWIERPRNVLQVHACTAVLVEVGYLTNPKDAEALKDPLIVDAMMPAFLGGIYRFLQIS